MTNCWISCLVAATCVVSSPLVSQVHTSDASAPSAPRPQAVIAGLAGVWHFELFQPGRKNAVAAGQRRMRLLSDSTKLVWTESSETTSDTGTGILGYDSAKDLYYVLGAYTHAPHPMVLLGRADGAAHTILFDQAAGNLETPGLLVQSELRIVDASHFEWVASPSFR